MIRFDLSGRSHDDGKYRHIYIFCIHGRINADVENDLQGQQ